jgi:hypothetical protein
MRSLPLVLFLAVAGPAAGQDGVTFSLHRQAETEAQAEMARQREVALYNQMQVLESQAQTQGALRDIDALRYRPPSLPVIVDPKAPRVIDARALASIPDDRLAASNARVRAAAQNRR